MIRIVEDPGQWIRIREYCQCLFEGDSMLFQVLACLRRIPLELRRRHRTAGSPTPTQCIQNCGCGSETSCLRRLPGCRQGLVQSAAFFVREVVAFIVRDKVDDYAFGRSVGLVDHPAGVETISPRTHAATVRFSRTTDK